MIVQVGRRSRHVRGLLARLSLFGAVAAVILAVPLQTTAYAHAERIKSSPEEGAKLDEVPTQMAIGFSEPPTGDSNLEVTDGCGNDVIDELKVANQQVSASLTDGQPGKWNVRSSVVSGLDGHPTKDSWSFTVSGQKDCSAGGGEGGGGRAGGDEDDAEESSFPVVPVALGALAVLAVAVLLRVLTGRSND